MVIRIRLSTGSESRSKTLLFRYMYVGKIEDLNMKSPCLLEAADKYQLSELKVNICTGVYILLNTYFGPWGCGGSILLSCVYIKHIRDLDFKNVIRGQGCMKKSSLGGG